MVDERSPLDLFPGRLVAFVPVRIDWLSLWGEPKELEKLSSDLSFSLSLYDFAMAGVILCHMSLPDSL